MTELQQQTVRGGAPRVPRPGGRPATRTLVVGLLLLVAAGLTPVLVAGLTGPEPARVDTPGIAAAVAVQEPAPAPSAPGVLTPVPAAGAVVQRPGPFDDRVVLDGFVLAEGTVRGTVDIVSDVSEVLALEVEVAWYDGDGVLVGSTRHVVPPEVAEEYHGSTGLTDLPIEVAAPGGVVATVQVPVLVNE